MSQSIDGNYKTFVASGALTANRRVRLDSNGEVAYASASDTDCIGCLVNDTLAQYDLTNVRVRTANGTQKMVCSEAITKGAAVYAAASGKVATSGTVLVGEALEASSANNDVLEVMESGHAILGAIARSALTEDALAEYKIPLENCKLPTLLQLAATAASGVPGLSAGTFGSASPQLIGNACSGNTKTDICRFTWALPPEYVAAGDVKVRIHADITGDLQVSQKVDVVAHESDDESGVGADLCATAAQSVTTSWADYDFVITATGLVAGDLLDIEVSMLADDTGGTANKLIEIGAISILCDIKG